MVRSKDILSVRHTTGSTDNNDNTIINRDLGDEHGMDRHKYIVQVVNDLWEIYPCGEDFSFEVEEERVCKVVVIGKNLDVKGLRRCLVCVKRRLLA